MDSLATLELPAVGYGIRYDFGMFEQSIDDGRQVERHDNWLQLGNPWELPRHEDAQKVRFYGRVEMRHDDSGRFIADWVDTRTVIGLPYDSFIVGPPHRHREHAAAVGGARDARLRPAVLQRGRLPPRRRGEDRHREHLQGPLPQRPERGGQGAAPQAAVLLRRLLDRRHRASVTSARTRRSTPSPTRWRSSSTTRTRRSRSPS